MAWLDFISEAFEEDRVQVTRSLDAGVSFRDPPIDATPQFARVKGFPGPTNFRVSTVPTIAVDSFDGDRVYVSYEAFADTADPADPKDADVYVVVSEDGGVNWSAPARVNDDCTTNDQFFPRMAVDDSGNVGLMWHDRRHDPSNSAYDIYFSVSTDNGQTWSRNLRVTDPNPATGLPRSDPGTEVMFIGDYDGMTAQGNTFFPVWADLRNWDGPGMGDPNWTDIYTARISMEEVSPPALIEVMGGIGAEYAGKADTFISPHADYCAFDSFEITVTEAVTMTCQEIAFTGAPLPPPVVTGLAHSSGGVHTVTLDPPLAVQHWAKITLEVVSDVTGCPGTLVMWVAHLPCDINQSANVNISDFGPWGTEWRRIPQRLEMLDTNCDGVISASDPGVFGQQFTPWNGLSLPTKP